MENLTPEQVWTAVLALASAIVLLSNAAEKIAKAVQAAKAPNVQLNERMSAMEEWKKEVEAKQNQDHGRFESIDEGMHVTQRALLALLDHGLDGNNVKQMQDAKDCLQHYLINR